MKPETLKLLEENIGRTYMIQVWEGLSEEDFTCPGIKANN
jgi:hypothetical protein